MDKVREGVQRLGRSCSPRGVLDGGRGRAGDANEAIKLQRCRTNSVTDLSPRESGIFPVPRNPNFTTGGEVFTVSTCGSPVNLSGRGSTPGALEGGVGGLRQTKPLGGPGSPWEALGGPGRSQWVRLPWAWRLCWTQTTAWLSCKEGAEGDRQASPTVPVNWGTTAATLDGNPTPTPPRGPRESELVVFSGRVQLRADECVFGWCRFLSFPVCDGGMETLGLLELCLCGGRRLCSRGLAFKVSVGFQNPCLLPGMWLLLVTKQMF